MMIMVAIHHSHCTSADSEQAALVAPDLAEDKKAAKLRLKAEKQAKKDAEKRQKKDLEHALEALKEAADAYADPGPVFDCLVYHDGERWVGAVDTTATGDFRRAKFMTNFRAGREWGTISGVAGTREHSVLLNYCLNVYEDGERLSIVTDCGSHGTHVPARPRTPRVAFAPRPPAPPPPLLPSGEERCAPLRPRADAVPSGE